MWSVLSFQNGHLKCEKLLLLEFSEPLVNLTKHTMVSYALCKELV